MAQVFNCLKVKSPTPAQLTFNTCLNYFLIQFILRFFPAPVKFYREGGRDEG